jgi:hypothetical protein
MLLLDMGGEYHCYGTNFDFNCCACSNLIVYVLGADITRSYPVDGKFTDKQRLVNKMIDIYVARNDLMGVFLCRSTTQFWMLPMLFSK